MRVSAPVTLSKPSDNPARKPEKTHVNVVGGLLNPAVMPGQAATTAI
jgi:hypothetical protein